MKQILHGNAVAFTQLFTDLGIMLIWDVTGSYIHNDILNLRIIV